MEHHFVVGMGMEIRTADGVSLGKVRHVGSSTFEVEKGIFFKRDLSLSYEDVERVERWGAVLRHTSEELTEIRRNGGIGTTFRERAVGAVDHAFRTVDDAVHPAHQPK